MHSSWLLGTRCGLPGARQGITVDYLSSAYNLFSNGAKDMTLYAQESLRLVRSLVGEVVYRRHLLNTDFSSCLDTGDGSRSSGKSIQSPSPW
jgi:hypothetical protein